MLFADLSLPEYLYLHLTKSLLFSDSWTCSSSTSAMSFVVGSILLTSLTGTPSSTFKSMQSTNLCNLLLKNLYPLLFVAYPKKMPSSALS
jgi:hypothetical protein